MLIICLSNYGLPASARILSSAPLLKLLRPLSDSPHHALPPPDTAVPDQLAASPTSAPWPASHACPALQQLSDVPVALPEAVLDTPDAPDAHLSEMLDALNAHLPEMPEVSIAFIAHTASSSAHLGYYPN